MGHFHHCHSIEYNEVSNSIIYNSQDIEATEGSTNK